MNKLFIYLFLIFNINSVEQINLSHNNFNLVEKFENENYIIYQQQTKPNQYYKCMLKKACQVINCYLITKFSDHRKKDAEEIDQNYFNYLKKIHELQQSQSNLIFYKEQGEGKGEVISIQQNEFEYDVKKTETPQRIHYMQNLSNGRKIECSINKEEYKNYLFANITCYLFDEKTFFIAIKPLQVFQALQVLYFSQQCIIM